MRTPFQYPTAGRSLCQAILVAGLFAFAMTAQAATFTVTSAADMADINPGDGICNASNVGSGPVCTLRAAIQEANATPNTSTAPDEIVVPPDTYTLTIAGTGEDLGATGDLDITEGVNIIGGGGGMPIIDAAGIDRVFDFHSGGSLKSLEITGGVTTGAAPAGDGAGIRCGSPGTYLVKLLVHDSLVHGNKASGSGGGVAPEPFCYLFLAYSEVANNTATQGGGIGSNDALIQMTIASVHDNQATQSGGGVLLGGGGGYAYVQNSTITGNSAHSGAGMVLSTQGFLFNTTVSGNVAATDAGGLNVVGGTTTITGSTIYCNAVTANNGVAGILLGGYATSVAIDHSIVARNSNAAGAADCNNLASSGYNLIGAVAGCTIGGNTTGNIINVDPLLVGPYTGFGMPAWLPQSQFSPTVDAGNPAGITYDHDANSATPGAPLVIDQRGLTRPEDGNHDGTFYPDIGAVESNVIKIAGFELDPGACPSGITVTP